MGYGIDEDYADDSEFVKLDEGFSVHNTVRDDVRRLLRSSQKAPAEPEFNPYIELFAEKEKRYVTNHEARVNDQIHCAWCNVAMKKKSYHQKFCSTAHKDHWWNMHPSRIERTRDVMSGNL